MTDVNFTPLVVDLFLYLKKKILKNAVLSAISHNQAGRLSFNSHSTYVEQLLVAISHIFAVLSADALRRDLLSWLHDNWEEETKLLVVLSTQTRFPSLKHQKCYKTNVKHLKATALFSMMYYLYTVKVITTDVMAKFQYCHYFAKWHGAHLLSLCYMDLCYDWLTKWARCGYLAPLGLSQCYFVHESGSL